jgi:hypothetical protein
MTCTVCAPLPALALDTLAVLPCGHRTQQEVWGRLDEPLRSNTCLPRRSPCWLCGISGR